ncbi:alpha/beta fold hydrolase [Bryocella elongata]|uniref:alpha/beta fold hydrolase n=1 Tax=Bryocella elongata TaxID=863522 RepID=UPI00135A374F|nr:alpha/beta hydrolase [Bryocella elongata]
MLATSKETYAYRRFGKASQCPLLLLQHFTGTLDNWDPAMTDALAKERDLIVFDNAGIGRSTGVVPKTVHEMAEHVQVFLEALEIQSCDVLGFSLGGMIAQQIALNNPNAFRKIVLVGTAPRGGTDIMHLDKPSLGRYFQDRSLKGYQILQKVFFAPSEASQRAGGEFIRRLDERKDDREPASGPDVAQAQLAAFREWEVQKGEPFADLRQIRQPTLVVNGVQDEMIPASNSYRLVENLPNAMLLIYPDAGHGSLFQWHESFARQLLAFLASDSSQAPY